MKFAVIVTSILSAQFVSSAFVDYGKIANQMDIKFLKKIKLRLQEDLKHLAAPGEMVAGLRAKALHHEQEELFFIPGSLLKPDLAKKAGLENLWSKWGMQNLTSGLQSVAIPQHSNNVFIFNRGENNSISDSLQQDVFNVINRSAPFESLIKMNLTNFFAVVNKKFLETQMPDLKLGPGSLGLKSILRRDAASFPIFKNLLSDKSPLMVFYFTSVQDSSKETPSDASTGLINSFNKFFREKSVYKENFFDKFAHNWIQKFSYDGLVRSVFCTTSSEDLENSYCIKIKDRKEMLFFPAYFDLSHVVDGYTPLSKFFENAVKVIHPKSSLNIFARSSLKSNSEIDYLKKKTKCLKNHISHKRDNGDYITKNSILIPTSFIGTLKSQVARNRKYSQVITVDEVSTSAKSSQILKRKYSIFSDDKENCEQITWYNIFHHSIFGSPRFCKD